jgi:hypothetical protein
MKILMLALLVAAAGCKRGGDAENVADVSDLNQPWGALQGKKIQLTAEYGGLRSETVEGKASYYVTAYDSADKAGDSVLCFIGHTIDEVRRANPDFDPPKRCGRWQVVGDQDGLRWDRDLGERPTLSVQRDTKTVKRGVLDAGITVVACSRHESSRHHRPIGRRHSR